MTNSVVKISMMSAKYFEYYTIILRGGRFSWTHCICWTKTVIYLAYSVWCYRYSDYK